MTPSIPNVPPKGFYEFLLAAGVPDDEGWVELPLAFLRGGQAELTDDDFLVLAEGLRATRPAGVLYPHNQATLVRNAGLKPNGATRIMNRLVNEGLATRHAGKTSFDGFWRRYPIGKKLGGYVRVPVWLLHNFQSLGWNSRDLRILILLGSYYTPDNEAPVLGSSQLGDVLGIDRGLASKNLKGFVDRTKLVPGFPEWSRTPRGYPRRMRS